MTIWRKRLLSRRLRRRLPDCVHPSMAPVAGRTRGDRQAGRRRLSRAACRHAARPPLPAGCRSSGAAGARRPPGRRRDARRRACSSGEGPARRSLARRRRPSGVSERDGRPAAARLRRRPRRRLPSAPLPRVARVSARRGPRARLAFAAAPAPASAQLPSGAPLQQATSRPRGARPGRRMIRTNDGARMGVPARQRPSVLRGADRLRRRPPELAEPRLASLPGGSRAGRASIRPRRRSPIFRRRRAAVERRQDRAGARDPKAIGRGNDAITIIRALWRDGNFDGWTEASSCANSATVLQKVDHKYRADRLLYAEAFAPAIARRGAGRSRSVALAQARTAAARATLSVALLKAIPRRSASDPGLLFASIQDARRAGRVYRSRDPARPRPEDRAAVINPDRWWCERRMVARELLDHPRAATGFPDLRRPSPPETAAAEVDAELPRRLDRAAFPRRTRSRPPRRFALAAVAADDPARRPPAPPIGAAGRRRRRATRGGARAFYEDAANEPIAYYGQLAAEKLGARPASTCASRKPAAEGDQRDEAVRAVEQLYADRLDDLGDRARLRRRPAPGATRRRLPRWRRSCSVSATPGREVQFGKIAPDARLTRFDGMAFPVFRRCRPSCRSPIPPTCLPSMRSRGRKANSSGARRHGRARKA